jgi:hypothetical protein
MSHGAVRPRHRLEAILPSLCDEARCRDSSITAAPLVCSGLAHRAAARSPGQCRTGVQRAGHQQGVGGNGPARRFKPHRRWPYRRAHTRAGPGESAGFVALAYLLVDAGEPLLQIEGFLQSDRADLAQPRKRGDPRRARRSSLAAAVGPLKPAGPRRTSSGNWACPGGPSKSPLYRASAAS